MTTSMLAYLARRTPSTGASYLTRRGFASDSAPVRKVAILGAAGGIGQPLSLLMKLNPLVSRLALYDISGTPGVAADVSHINTRSEVNLVSSFFSAHGGGSRIFINVFESRNVVVGI